MTPAKVLEATRLISTGTIYSPPLFGLGIRGAQTFVAPLLEAEARVALHDPLYAVLSQGAPLLPNSRYDFDADAMSLAGTAFHAGWSGGGWGGSEGDGLYVGAFAKYVMGFGFGMAETRLGLATADTIFGDQDPLDVTFDASTRYSPFGRVGNSASASTLVPDPPDKELGQILFCDWMPAEGWVKDREKGRGLSEVWIKRE